ncbi:hypothetical protein [Desulfonema magnum]|uniref:Uncharacterized protein n=1 Tax=Desulfonema magnum TaxID=45655 RepID=A0A975BUC7_9BACT|nr:hypothetical protein [Desulfonema magnum]QTA91793.1 Uncharacterized protein dnm_078670 [Desulfonema magnum]
MYAVEFRTKVTDGIIQIPEKYRKKIKNNVRVILLAEDSADTTSDIIEDILESPLKLPDFRSFKREEIYDRG